MVTAYVESLGGARNPFFFTCIRDEDIVPTNFDIFNEEIVCDDSEYDAYIEKMRAVNEDILIWDEEYVDPSTGQPVLCYLDYESYIYPSYELMEGHMI